MDAELRELVFVLKLSITDELDETRRQLMEKLILLTVLGYENSGKSTLLNSLLGERLAYCNYNNQTCSCKHKA